MEARCQAENEQKRLEEEAARRAEEERVRAEFDASANEQRLRQERMRKVSEEVTPAPEKKPKAEQRHVKFNDQPLPTPVAAAKPVASTTALAKPAPEAETQFTHLKIKKPDYVAPVVQQKPVEAISATTEEVKKPVIRASDEPSRKQRKLQAYLKDAEKRKKYSAGETAKLAEAEKEV
jgi:hypothetical protein